MTVSIRYVTWGNTLLEFISYCMAGSAVTSDNLDEYAYDAPVYGLSEVPWFASEWWGNSIVFCVYIFIDFPKSNLDNFNNSSTNK